MRARGPLLAGYLVLVTLKTIPMVPPLLRGEAVKPPLRRGGLEMLASKE